MDLKAVTLSTFSYYIPHPMKESAMWHRSAPIQHRVLWISAKCFPNNSYLPVNLRAFAIGSENLDAAYNNLLVLWPNLVTGAKAMKRLTL